MHLFICFRGIRWEGYIRTKPMVHPEVWEEVPNEQVVPAKSVTKIDETGDGDSETQVAQENQLGVLSLVQRTAGVEVANATSKAVVLALAAALALALVVVVAGDVGQEVVGPTNQLLANQVDEGDDGGLLAELRQFVGQASDPARPLLARLGYEDHVPRHVSGSLVVLAVRNFPAEVGHEQRRVQDPTDGVVEDLGRAEGLVAAFVSEDPNTGAEEPLDESVHTPEHRANGGRGDVLGRQVGVEEVEGRG